VTKRRREATQVKAREIEVTQSCVDAQLTLRPSIFAILQKCVLQECMVAVMPPFYYLFVDFRPFIGIQADLNYNNLFSLEVLESKLRFLMGQ